MIKCSHVFIDMDDWWVSDGYVCCRCGLSRYPEAISSILLAICSVIKDDGGWTRTNDPENCNVYLKRTNGQSIEDYLKEKLPVRMEFRKVLRSLLA